MSILLLLVLLPIQYSAYSGIPYPNCVDDLGDTVILHWTGSCGGQPFWDNMAYFVDMGYHVSDSNKIANGEATTTMTKGIAPSPPTAVEEQNSSNSLEDKIEKLKERLASEK